MTTMDYAVTMRALRGLKVQTGSLVCLGCGYEHHCSTRGCAILRNAVEHMELMHSELIYSRDARKDLTMQLKEVQKQVDQLTNAALMATDKANQAIAEKNAIMEDLKGTCEVCAHVNSNPDCDCECLKCKLDCPCWYCRDGSRFEWRGMQKEA